MAGGVLPDDLLLEILHRLPIKSLLRFQSVSKSWRRYMHYPDFIARHLRQVTESNSSTIITLDEATRSYERDEVSFSLFDSPTNLLTFSCKANKDLEVIGSCNGLLCLLFQGRFVIISNLLIKDHHMIPIPLSTPCKKSSEFLVGFGYDPVKDDYKVVKIVSHEEGNSSPSLAETSVYSLRCNAWSQKRVSAVGRGKGFPYLGHRLGVVASGALHWLASVGSSLFIVAFNLTTEDFYEMSLPDQVSQDGEMSGCTEIGVLNGCLCVSSRVFHGHPYRDIWVMKEYGIHSPWTKLFQLMAVRSGYNVDAPIPLIHFKNVDQIVLLQENPKTFRLCDMGDGKLMDCVSNNVNPVISGEVKAICLSTIVSLRDYRTLWEEKDLSCKGRTRKRRREDKSSSRGVGRIEDDVEKNVQALKAFFYLRDQFIKGLSSNLRREQQP